MRTAILAPLFLSPFTLLAQSEGMPEPVPEPQLTLEQALAEYKPLHGTVALRGIAEVRLPEGWVFLEEEQGRRYLRELGNQVDEVVAGVVMPANAMDTGIFAVYSTVDEGHVDDSETPDYGELLSEMQESSRAQSEERRQAGLGGVELLGWAEQPHYDRAQHKLYWAERLQFEGEEGEVLNYNVRILGRTDLLVVQGVGGIEQLPDVAADCKTLLGVTDFLEGKRYEDFDPEYDKLAAYGIGGLIAGKMALKVGLFAKLGLLLKAFIKPILIGLAVLGGGLWKVLGGRKVRAQAERRQARRAAAGAGPNDDVTA